jgi:DNA-binding transcriptional LysR family regulator
VEDADAYRTIDLKALRCFLAMGTSGSLTRAGLELGISEPAISKRIRALEAYLGVKLYETRGGRVTLTASGDRVLEMAAPLFEMLGDFERGLAQEATTGSLTVTAEEPVQFYLLPPIVDKFRRLFPRVELRLLSRTVPLSIELVRRNEADLAILPRRDFGSGLVFHEWRTFSPYLIIPRTHVLVRSGVPDIRALLRPEIMERVPLIVGEAQMPVIRSTLEGLGLPVNIGLEVGSAEVVKRLASLGLGIGVVSGISINETDADSLVIIPIPAQYGGSTTYGVLTRRGKYRAAPMRSLYDLLGLQL